MKTNIDYEKRRTAPPPVGAPSAATAKAVWTLLKPVLGVEFAKLYGPGPDRAAAELTAQLALVVGLEAAVVAGRDRERWTINRAFDTVARVWSPTFRKAGARKSRDMREETVKTARRELATAGVKFDELWRGVLCEGLPDIYRTQLIGGKDHAHGRRVLLAPNGDRAAYEKLIAAECATRKGYRRPPERRRLLLGRQQTPTARVARKVAGESEYNVAEIGLKSKRVIEIFRRYAAVFGGQRGPRRPSGVEGTFPRAPVAGAVRRVVPRS